MRILDIKTTYRCNNLCQLCCQNRDLRQLNSDMTFNEAAEIIKKEIVLGVDKIVLTGGEPLLNKDILKIISYAHDMSITTIQLQTNGRLLKDKSFLESDLTMTKYADSFVYEIHLKTNSTDYYLTIDKKSFAVVEFSFISYNRVKEVSPNNFLRDAKVVYKYRPHNGNWVLKETSAIWNTTYEKDDEKTDLDMNFSIIVNDYSLKPFPEFNKSVNEKMDIRSSFK